MPSSAYASMPFARDGSFVNRPSRHRGTLLIALMLLGVLLLTNRHGTLPGDAGLIQRCCTDAHAYLEIARAFPGLPDEHPRTLSFHHAQRFALPWLAGGLARMTLLTIDGSFRALTIGLALGIILMTRILLHQVGASAATQTGLLVMFVFNAYAFRFTLAFPWYVTDLGFVFGLVLTLLGLLRVNAAVLLAGLLIAAGSRQTALLILPTILAWLAFEGDSSTRRARIALMFACPLLVVGVYHATAWLASGFATGSTNIEKITGLFTWFARDFRASTLAQFGARMLLPVLPVLLLGAALAARHRAFLRADLRFWLLVSMSVTIAAQPALGGPATTGGNAPRLVMLGFVPLLVALAHVMSASGVGLPNTRQFWTIFGTAAFLSSLHHMHSLVGHDDSRLASVFGILFTLASLVMAHAAWAGWRSPKHRTANGYPGATMAAETPP